MVLFSIKHSQLNSERIARFETHYWHGSSIMQDDDGTQKFQHAKSEATFKILISSHSQVLDVL